MPHQSRPVNTAVDNGDSSTSDPQRKRSAKTTADYELRYNQLVEAAEKEMGGIITHLRLIEWIIDDKRSTWSPSTWRQNRAALRHGLERAAHSDPTRTKECEALIALLEDTPPMPPEQRVPRTSQQKAKRLEKNDLKRICHRLLAGRSPNAPILVDFLLATAVTALRPAEWRSAKFSEVNDPSLPFQLVVENAKHDTVRAHGKFRTLRWGQLSDQLRSAILNVIAEAQRFQEDNDYQGWLNTLGDLLYRTTKALFPKRTKRPTLYTFRHEAIARFKARYVENQSTPDSRAQGLAIVAALCGHATDETATRHYGRPRRGERTSLPIPAADPAEVARIRKVMGKRFERLRDLSSKGSLYKLV